MRSTSMVTVLTHATVFDGTRFLPGTRDVVIDGGRVAAVTEVGQGSHNADNEFGDCTGRTILPGIIDCRVHLTSSGAAATSNYHAPFPLQFSNSVAHMDATYKGRDN